MLKNRKKIKNPLKFHQKLKNPLKFRQKIQKSIENSYYQFLIGLLGKQVYHKELTAPKMGSKKNNQKV